MYDRKLDAICPRLSGAVHLCLLLFTLTTTQSYGAEPIPIGKILAAPKSYHLQIIPIRGIVHQVMILAPHDPLQPGDPCYGAYTFTLEDETGAITIGVLGHSGHCSVQTGAETPEVSEGDKVVIEAQIHATGHYTEEYKSPIPRDRDITEAIAVRITQLKP